MAKTASARSGPLPFSLPDEIVIWEILVRLPPKALIRCRAVCHTWRRATSVHDFLLTHHGHQPSLPIVSSFEQAGPHYHNILEFDHRATGAQLQPVARLRYSFYLEASCNGLLVLSQYGVADTCFFVCNPATRQHAPLSQLQGFNFLGMYPHRPTGEYRLLLQRPLPKGKIACYVFVLGSNQPPRYIGGLESAPEWPFKTSSLFNHNLHWYPVQHESGNKPLLVFDSTVESFRHMHAPVVTTRSYLLEMDDTIGIYTYNDGMKFVDIWVLQNYESEVWNYKYRVELPAAEIRERLGRSTDYWNVGVVSVDADVFLLLNIGGWVLYVDTDGKLVDSFHRDGQHLYTWRLRLKQTLVRHTFFAALEGYGVNRFPFTSELLS